ncbi:DNA mismatch repair protein MutL [Haladaptatus sp. W1]|uniref:DNA mismatch repair endonuclease MutL n=1 Tax=Haladaptatus sp. W1 TaxID=1897478 RepID=UPI000849DE8C|nr:DNA mismatch repair endonuclease MutL [Haladaptatus sp. W1]ODR82183.1 DNA mismatch repair protein MutL [Haladaptatus sp. W1]
MSDGETNIRALSETTIQRIAAGEVVERPASVVKELVENSLDADASRISVRVDGGGTERIAVTDDGIGMSREDVQIAVEEHTTSKIRDIDDLESGVATLGFRGEALYTIGAVSRTKIRTKPRGGESGTELRLVGGDVEGVGPAGCPEGTTVEVEDLFFNTPARRKYLKTDSTEFAHVNRVVTQYALANPDVAFSLEHDGREVFSTTGRGNLQSTILSVYGREVATAMIAVDGGDAVDVSGYVSHPETTRSTREYVATYVNGRYVRSSVVREAILDAYGNQLAPDRYPFAVLFLDVPADSVDVNVHPRKMEVRFGDEARVKTAVRDAVQDALLDNGLVRASAPRGRSAPDETDVTPEPVQSELGDGDSAGRKNASGETADSNAATASKSGSRTAASDSHRSESSDAEATEPDRTTSSGHGSTTGRTATESRTESPTSGDSTTNGTATTNGDTATERRSAEGNSAGKGSATDAARDPERKFSAPTATTTLPEAGGEGAKEADEASFERLPSMRVLGQLHDTYVVAETGDGLVLIDQHAADERVNYERLCRQFAGDTTTQVLASSVELELTAAEAALFDDYREALARLGFHAALVGDRTVEVTTVPAVFEKTLSPDLLRDVLSEFISVESGDANSAEAVADELISDLACYPSITGNTSLREGDVVSLLAALDECENPYACPHGRPVVIEFNREEIEDRFERDYPGHAGRRAE